MFSNTYYFVTAWFLLHVYVLVDVLDFIRVLYQSCVFKNILVYSGWGGVRLLSISVQNNFRTPRKLLWGLKTKLRGTFGNFNVSLAAGVKFG